VYPPALSGGSEQHMRHQTRRLCIRGTGTRASNICDGSHSITTHCSDPGAAQRAARAQVPELGLSNKAQMPGQDTVRVLSSFVDFAEVRISMSKARGLCKWCNLCAVLFPSLVMDGRKSRRSKCPPSLCSTRAMRRICTSTRYGPRSGSVNPDSA